LHGRELFQLHAFCHRNQALAFVGSQRWNQKNERSSRMASSDFSSAN